MNKLNKILLTSALFIFTGQAVVATEYPQKGVRDDYPGHAHLNEPTQKNDAMPKQRENYMMQKHDEEDSLDSELFPDPEN